jgi:hypothetical protein
MAAKMCNMNCGRRAYTGTGAGVDTAARGSELCNLCYTEGGWENEHQDYGHETNDVDGCWMCHPELNLATRPVRTGHTNTVAKTHRSHAACDHPVTPKARAACRKAGGPKA